MIAPVPRTAVRPRARRLLPEAADVSLVELVGRPAAAAPAAGH